jgi:malate dehydrogenase (oxaloacetate-decarboxylating)
MLCNMTLDPITFHKQAKGKIRSALTHPIAGRDDLALTYTPGVAVPAREIARERRKVWEYTGRRNRVAIVSDGSAVLGLGNVGPEAALPVMEGKAALFKQFADIDAFPLCIAAESADRIIETVKAVAPSFGGINLEDIAAPRCFEVEEALRRALDIPVFHDDQHGTAIVLLAGLKNALKVARPVPRHAEEPRGALCREASRSACWPPRRDIRIVISGAGAAGTAIARILLSQGFSHLLVCDSKGIISRSRSDLESAAKTFLAASTNPQNREGNLKEAMKGADVFIGVSAPGLVTKDMVRSMNEKPIIFAMANPDPEIMPDDAKDAGASVVATGRSDFPNQVNNILAFPGVFRGALDAEARDITEAMKLAATEALAACVPEPKAEKILPDPLEQETARNVAKAVEAAANGHATP